MLRPRVTTLWPVIEAPIPGLHLVLSGVGWWPPSSLSIPIAVSVPIATGCFHWSVLSQLPMVMRCDVGVLGYEALYWVGSLIIDVGSQI